MYRDYKWTVRNKNDRASETAEMVRVTVEDVGHERNVNEDKRVDE